MVGGVEDIKKVKYFNMNSQEWARMYEQKDPSPLPSWRYIPKVKGPGDCDQFDKYPEEQVKWYGDGQDKFGTQFVGF